MRPKSPRDHVYWWRHVLDPPYQFVYVIRDVSSEAIKIGVASDVHDRLATLQCGNPRRLQVLYVFPGGYELETRIHRWLRSDHLHGEWFDGPLVAEVLPQLEILARRMVDAYDGSHQPPTFKGHVKWPKDVTYMKPKKKHPPVTVRHVDPASLVP